MSNHAKQIRAIQRKQRNLWSVGCACGWRRVMPLRGSEADAGDSWRGHRAQFAPDAAPSPDPLAPGRVPSGMRSLDRLMQSMPAPRVER